MQWVFKVGYKKLVPDLTERLKYWSDCQLVDIRPSGFYPAKSGKHFCIVEDGKDYWKVRGTVDWKSTQKSVYDLKKYLYVADANGRYPWDKGYNENTVPARKRDFFLDFKSLLDSKLILPSQFDQIYDKSREGIITIDRDITQLLIHEDAKTRLQSIYSEKTGTIAQDGAGAGTGGGFTIGAAGDYATWTLFEAAIAAQLTGDLHGLGLDEETAITGNVIFDTDTNTHTLYLTAEAGCEHNGGAYGNGARIDFGTNDRLSFDETNDGDLDDVEISNLALSVFGSGNIGVYFADGGNSGLFTANRILIGGDADSLLGIFADDECANARITNNICYGIGKTSGSVGIRIDTISEGQSMYVANNTCCKCFDNFRQNAVSMAGTFTFKNNIAQADSGLNDYTDNGGGFGTHGNNISEDATSPDAAYRSKDLHTNSIFLNYAGNDYRLDPAGDVTNLAIVDDGEDLSGTFTDDIEGQTRSTWYIGASEIVAAGGENYEKNFGDTINLSDGYAGSFGLNKADAISLSDGIARMPGLNKVDSISLSDIRVNSARLNKADSVSLSDNMTRIVAFARALGDTLNLSDERASLFGHPEADSITLSDGIIKAPGINRADSIALADEIAKQFSTAFGDSITLSDNLVSIIITLILHLNDSIDMSDEIAKEFGINKEDTISLADNMAYIAAFIRSLSDTINLSDGRVLSAGLNKADSISLSDGMTKAVWLSRADTFSLSDEIIKLVALDKSDSIALTDDILKLVGLSATDSISITDLMVKGFGLSMVDSIALADGLALEFGLFRSDTINLTDSHDIISDILSPSALRTYLITAQSRVLTIIAQNRAVAVAAENRELSHADEDRSLEI